MDYKNRIVKEMTESLVRALLIDAGYQAIRTGLEDVVGQPDGVVYPKALCHLPDLTVTDRLEAKASLVEIKYRSHWCKKVLINVCEQVKTLHEMTLVGIWSQATNPNDIKSSPSRYIRCCRMKFEDNTVQAELLLSSRRPAWQPVADIEQTPEALWFQMQTLPAVFTRLSDKPKGKTLEKTVEALSSIFD